MELLRVNTKYYNALTIIFHSLYRSSPVLIIIVAPCEHLVDKAKYPREGEDRRLGKIGSFAYVDV